MKAKPKLRVFHGLLNYGTQAGYIAKGLREIGIEAKSFTKNDPYDRITDFQFKPGKTAFQKLYREKIKYPLVKVGCFFRYNVFHFYYGSSLFPQRMDLPLYRLFGKKVIMHYLGNDVELYQWSRDNYRITNVTDMMDDKAGALHDKKILKRMKYESRYLDQKIVCAPQYSPFVPDAEFIPLALDLDTYNYHPMPPLDGPLKIVHAPTSRKKKGTKYLVEAVDRLIKEGYSVELDICEGLKHQELLDRYLQAHISVVALMGGWYGTAGVEAMALGRPIVTFIRESLFEYVDLEKKDLPIISANKETIYEVLKEVLNSTEKLEHLSKESYRFVKETHDYRQIARRVADIYNNLP